LELAPLDLSHFWVSLFFCTFFREGHFSPTVKSGFGNTFFFNSYAPVEDGGGVFSVFFCKFLVTLVLDFQSSVSCGSSAVRFFFPPNFWGSLAQHPICLFVLCASLAKPPLFQLAAFQPFPPHSLGWNRSPSLRVWRTLSRSPGFPLPF